MIHTKEKRRLSVTMGQVLPTAATPPPTYVGQKLAVPGKALSYILSETKGKRKF